MSAPEHKIWKCNNDIQRRYSCLRKFKHVDNHLFCLVQQMKHSENN